MVKISVTSYENEIHTVDSPSNEDSKSVILCQRDLTFWGGMAGKMQEMLKNWEFCCLQMKGWSISLCTPWYQNRCSAFICLQVGPNYLIKTEEASLKAKFCPL